MNYEEALRPMTDRMIAQDNELDSLRSRLSLAQGQIEKMNGALDKIERLVIGGDVYQAFAYAQTIAAEALSSLPRLKTEDVKKEEM